MFDSSAKVFCPWIGDRSSNPKDTSKRQGPFGVVFIPVEGVKNEGNTFGVAGERFENLCGSVSIVDDEWLAETARELNLPEERHFLSATRRKVPIEVEPCLSDGDHFRVMGEFFKTGTENVIPVAGVMRVKSHRCPTICSFFGEPNGFLGAFFVESHHQKASQTRFASPLKNAFSVYVEIPKLKMRVRVEENGTHLTFAPGVTSRRNSAMHSPFPSSAASNIPCDSTPSTFRGAKFATRSTRLPTTSAGV